MIKQICVTICCIIVLAACKEEETSNVGAYGQSLLNDAETTTYDAWVRSGIGDSDALFAAQDFYENKLAQDPNNPRLLAEQAVVANAITLMSEALEHGAVGSDRKADNATRAYLLAWANAEIAAEAQFKAVEVAIREGLKPYYDSGQGYSEAEWEVVRRDVGANIPDLDITAITTAYLMRPATYNATNRLRRVTHELRDDAETLYWGDVMHGLHQLARFGSDAETAAFHYGTALNKAGRHAEAVPVFQQYASGIFSPSSAYNGETFVPIKAFYQSAIAAEAGEAIIWQAKSNLLQAIQTDFARTNGAFSAEEKESPLLQLAFAEDHYRWAQGLWDVGLQEDAHQIMIDGLAYAKDDTDQTTLMTNWLTAHPLPAAE